MSKPKPEPVSGDGYDWRSMDTAPKTRVVYLTAPTIAFPDDGVLGEWKVTRARDPKWKQTRARDSSGQWQTKEGWVSVLTRRPIDFEPTGWREGTGRAAAAYDAEKAAADTAERRRLAEAQAIYDRDRVASAMQDGVRVEGSAEVASWEVPKHKAPAEPPFKPRAVA